MSDEKREPMDVGLDTTPGSEEGGQAEPASSRLPPPVGASRRGAPVVVVGSSVSGTVGSAHGSGTLLSASGAAGGAKTYSEVLESLGGAVGRHQDKFLLISGSCFDKHGKDRLSRTGVYSSPSGSDAPEKSSYQYSNDIMRMLMHLALQNGDWTALPESSTQQRGAAPAFSVLCTFNVAVGVLHIRQQDGSVKPVSTKNLKLLVRLHTQYSIGSDQQIDCDHIFVFGCFPVFRNYSSARDNVTLIIAEAPSTRRATEASTQTSPKPSMRGKILASLGRGKKRKSPKIAQPSAADVASSMSQADQSRVDQIFREVDVLRRRDSASPAPVVSLVGTNIPKVYKFDINVGPEQALFSLSQVDAAPEVFVPMCRKLFAVTIASLTLYPVISEASLGTYLTGLMQGMDLGGADP